MLRSDQTGGLLTICRGKEAHQLPDSDTSTGVIIDIIVE